MRVHVSGRLRSHCAAPARVEATRDSSGGVTPRLLEETACGNRVVGDIVEDYVYK